MVCCILTFQQHPSVQVQVRSKVFSGILCPYHKISAGLEKPATSRKIIPVLKMKVTIFFQNNGKFSADYSVSQPTGQLFSHTNPAEYLSIFSIPAIL
jgi:hypothetical protein